MLPSNRMAVLLAAAIALVAGGCAGLVSRAGAGLSRDITAGILEQDDPQLVAEGLPAYILLLDGMLQGSPDDPALLLASSRLYGAYAGAFAEDPDRRRRLAAKALERARRAVCLTVTDWCAALDLPHDVFADAFADIAPARVELAYALAGAWAGAIQADPDDFDRIAELPKVETLLENVVATDPAVDGGTAWMYLGVLRSLRPAALGGEPEAGRAAFEEALARSQGRNQMARVLYAEYYARLVFDQALHDRLLDEALAAETRAPGLTLANVLAQRRARELMASGRDYF